MPLPRALARFNRRVTNYILGPLAYVTPPWAIVVHHGRRTGRTYRTPVWAFRTNGGFVIALTYGGAQTQWVRNVLAEGGTRLIRGRTRLELTDPRVLHGNEGLEAVPAFTRPALRALRVDDYLMLNSSGEPG